MLWRVRQHGFAARCRAMSTSAQQAATRRPFLLGLGAATATTAAATITFSVTLWPLADLLGAPPLISMSLGAAASAEPALEALGRGDLKDVARLQALLDGGEDGKGGRIVSLTGSSQSRRSFLLSHAAAGRPVFYLTLREATSTHALLSTTAQQLNRRSAECRDDASLTWPWWHVRTGAAALRAARPAGRLLRLRRPVLDHAAGACRWEGSTEGSCTSPPGTQDVFSCRTSWRMTRRTCGLSTSRSCLSRRLSTPPQLSIRSARSLSLLGALAAQARPRRPQRGRQVGAGRVGVGWRRAAAASPRGALDLALADVVVTSAGGSPAAAAAEAAWKSGYGAGAAERSRLYYGATAVAFSQPEPAEAWVAALGRSGAGTA